MVKIMKRNLLFVIAIIVVTAITAKWLLNKPRVQTPAAAHHEHGERGSAQDDHGQDHGSSESHHAGDDSSTGPHNGRLLQQDQFALEVTIFESGVPPEFHIYPYFQDHPVDPATVDLSVVLIRTGDVIEHFEFEPQADFLRGDNIVSEPHSFDVTVMATYRGKQYHWEYENHEGRTQIPDDLAREANIQTEMAGPAIIRETLLLTGRVEVDPNRLAQVRPRFPGVVKSIHTELGTTVTAGQRMLTVQSNESLQSYSVTAPISGLVINRNVQVGEATADGAVFTIVDLSRVWVSLDVFARDIGRVKEGQVVTVNTLDGFVAEGAVDWLSPLSSHASQSIHARVPMDNADGGLRPGQFVQAEVGVAEYEVPLAVRRSAVQRFRDFQVVFAKFGETYEVRMLEFGIGNDEWLQVVTGLAPGTEYVTENSYLIKADIEKSGATHDH